MTNFSPQEIEEKEKEVLFKLGMMFKDSIGEFSTSMDRSLKYLDKIAFPIIMGSQQNRSYNPFAEIIEKYILHILTRKLEKEGYNLLPLGYSSDLTVENQAYILNIDIKTANIENLSDFSNTINVGINQMTHVAKLPIKGEDYLQGPFFVYPNLPPYYKLSNKSYKLILTYGLMFIYPSYRELIEDINKSFKELLDLFHEKTKILLTKEKKNALEIFGDKKIDLITENLLRGVFIHQQEKENIIKSLNINKKEIKKFLAELKNLTNNLRNKDIKPIAVIAISIPNGLLKDKYLDKFVSGKEYGRSSRYHYEDGVFEVLKEKTGQIVPRVIFLDLDLKEEYMKKLRRYFKKINVLEYELKELC